MFAMAYTELHAHSAYSFLDGASLPEELAVRAAELGYEALALTDHDGVYGSLEFAHAAKAFGVRPITGAEVTLRGRLARHAAGGVGARLREPLPAADRRACRDTSEGGRARAGSGARPGAAGGAERRSGVPVGLLAVRARGAEPERRGPAGAGVRARALLRRAPAAVRAGRRAAERAAAGPRGGAAGRDGRDGRRPRACGLARSAAGRAGGDPAPHLARGLGARAAREPRGGAPPAGRGGGPLSARPGRRRADGAGGRALRVRPDAGARLSLPGLLGRGRTSHQAPCGSL